MTLFSVIQTFADFQLVYVLTGGGPANATHVFGTYAYQVAITPGMENYPVYHSAAVFLLDPQARYHAVFTPPHDAEAISRRFKVVRELEAGNAT